METVSEHIEDLKSQWSALLYIAQSLRDEKQRAHAVLIDGVSDKMIDTIKRLEITLRADACTDCQCNDKEG